MKRKKREKNAFDIYLISSVSRRADSGFYKFCCCCGYICSISIRSHLSLARLLTRLKRKNLTLIMHIADTHTLARACLFTFAELLLLLLLLLPFSLRLLLHHRCIHYHSTSSRVFIYVGHTNTSTWNPMHQMLILWPRAMHTVDIERNMLAHCTNTRAPPNTKIMRLPHDVRAVALYNNGNCRYQIRRENGKRNRRRRERTNGQTKKM